MLDGRVAIVTGSTSGIGLGIARALASSGAQLVINGLGDTGEIERLRSGLESEFGVSVFHSATDMRYADEVAAMVHTAIAAFDRVDILVNNAGVQHVAPVEEFPVERWDAILAINLSAAFHAMRAVIPNMRTRRWGRIISTASAHSLVASPYKSAYVAAKHGLVGLTKTVALETATAGITVNCISPGYVWTPLVERQIPATMKARGLTEEEVKRDVLLAAQPTKEFVTIEQVAAMATFLCSEAAAQITGANISIDGGWTAQ